MRVSALISIISSLSLVTWTISAAAATHSVPFLPHQATPFKALLQQEAVKALGKDAPIALLASMVEVESGWNPRALSPSGDAGLAQIHPSTARYLNHIRPGPGRGNPRDPKWALSAMSWYMWHLKGAIKGAANETEHVAMTLASYNGGLGNLLKERKMCAASKGCDPGKWFGNIERFKRRSARAFKENRSYVVKVFKRQAAYISWGPMVRAP
jgi:membrane-bound lytic murein transglycosylase MltF